jgi:hypothetical protein
MADVKTKINKPGWGYSASGKNTNIDFHKMIKEEY